MVNDLYQTGHTLEERAQETYSVQPAQDPETQERLRWMREERDYSGMHFPLKVAVTYLASRAFCHLIGVGPELVPQEPAVPDMIGAMGMFFGTALSLSAKIYEIADRDIEQQSPSNTDD